MKKKLISLALIAGAAYTASKLISGRKTEKGYSPTFGFYSEFYEVRYQRDNGDITEEKYWETLNAIRDKAVEIGETTVNNLLDEMYSEAEYTACYHLMLVEDVESTDAESLEDFIKRYPDKAFKNGVLGLNEFCYEEQAKISADYIAKEYFRKLNKTESCLFEFVEVLGGDIGKIKQEFDKIRNYNLK